MATITGMTATKILDMFSGFVPRGELIISVKDGAAVGDGVTDDTVAIQASLTNAPPGSTVFLPAGTYVTSAPLMIPPQVELMGTHGGHIDDLAFPTLKPSASFVGAAVILMVDQVTGGYSQVSNEQRITKLSIDGSNLPGTTIDAIQAQGYVHGVYLTDLQIRHVPGHGVTTLSNSSGTPYSWRATRVHVSSSGSIGIVASMTDATWTDCEVIGSSSHGWYTGGASNSIFTACRSEWSAVDGYNFGSGTGTGQGSGGPTFIGCTTDRNGNNGVSIPSPANGNAPITFVGCVFRRDGRSSTSAGYAAVNINGSSQPIILTGCTVYTGVADDGTGNLGPQYGLSGNNANVQINGGSWHGVVEGIHNSGTNVRFARGLNIIERTGPTAAPVTVTRGLQSHGVNGDSLDVPGHLAGISHPREHGLAGWTYPPESVSAGSAGVAGTLYLAKVPLPRPLTLTKMGWGISAAGVSPVAGQNWIVLYDSTGVKLAAVAVDGRVTTVGAWAETIINTPAITDFYYFGFLFNAATMPAIFRAGFVSASLVNINLPNSSLRFATNGTGLTTPPAVITPSSSVASQNSYFGAIG